MFFQKIANNHVTTYDSLTKMPEGDRSNFIRALTTEDRQFETGETIFVVINHEKGSSKSESNS
jgi:hypothetical protein